MATEDEPDAMTGRGGEGFDGASELRVCPREMPVMLRNEIEALMSFRNVEMVEFWHAFQAWGSETGLFAVEGEGSSSSST